MTGDGDPRAPTRIGLWLAVSVLAHVLAVPMLKTGPVAGGGAGDDLRVTLVAASRPAAATPSSGQAGDPSGDVTDRRRAGDRRRDSRTGRQPQPDEPLATGRPATQIAAASPDEDAVSGEAPAPSNRSAGKPAPAREPAGGQASAADRPPASETARPVATTRPAKVPASSADAPMPVTATDVAAAAPTAQPPAARSETSATDGQPGAAAPVPVTATNTAAAAPPAQPPAATGSAVAETSPASRRPSAGRPAGPTPAAARSETSAADGQPVADASGGAAATPPAGTAARTLAGEVSAGPQTGVDSALIALLHRAIDNEKRYPSMARRQRREGIATVLFRLHPDGALDGLELASSSGFELLDKAALRAVAGVAPFTPATRYLKREKRFSVEVEFRLF